MAGHHVSYRSVESQGKVYAEGARAWPGVALDPGVFRAYLEQRLIGEDTDRAADLYLACACLEGVPGATDALLKAHTSGVVAATRSLVPDPESLLSRVWLHLVGEKTRLAQYKGRGPLSAFIKVAAVRLVLGEKRKKQPAAPGDGEVERIVDSFLDPEIAYLKRLYREEFRVSFARAMDELSADQKLLLKLDVTDGLTVDQMALVYGRTRSTTGRHLQMARAHVADATLKDLKSRLSIRDSELDSVARLVRSQLDLSVERLLG